MTDVAWYKGVRHCAHVGSRVCERCRGEHRTVAVTTRGVDGWGAFATIRENAVRHRVTGQPRRYSFGGHTYVADCGAQVAHVTTDDFDPEHPRACPKCVKA